MVCTNPNCHKDCPYAESPSPSTFRCYECRMISDMMGSGAATIAPKAKVVSARHVKIGDKVHRYDKKGSDAVVFTVADVFIDEFQATNAAWPRGTWISYGSHCKLGQYPCWVHEDGSQIIPP